jgi:uncharacterized membrane protein
MFATGRAAVVPAVAGDWLALLFYGTCLALALLVAALVIELVRRWARKGESTPSASDQLAHYRTMYNRGEISQEEFDRLRAVLGGEIVPGARPAAPPRPPAPAQSPPNGPPAPPADGLRPQ